MSDLKTKDLIQAKVLGCLDADDETVFTKLMKDDPDFPWEEFGKYQNLVACLPTLLEAETPDQEVKDSIARKLMELKEQEKVDEIVEEPPEIMEEEKPAPIETVDDMDITIEEENIETDIDSEQLSDNKSKGITFKQHELLHGTLKNKGKTDSEIPRSSEEKIQRKTNLTSSKKDFKRQNVRSHISKSPAYIEPPVQTDNKKGTMIAIILFIIALIAIVIVYFSLSSDIQNNKEEIEKLKEQLYSYNATDSYYMKS